MKFTKITISDKNGVKNYKFSANFKFQLLLVGIFFSVFIAVLVFGIFHLNSKNSDLKILSKRLYEQNLELNNKILELSQTKQIQTPQKTEQEINDIELMMAFDSIENELKSETKPPINSVDNTLQDDFLKFIPNGFPLPNRGITSLYGNRTHPIIGTARMHHGIDLRAKEGTPVVATADGFVEYSANSKTGYGYLVVLSHNYGFKTRYGHLMSMDVVRVGQWVKKGEIIAYSGNTGLSTGPHLHYEIRFLERTIDPLNFLNWNLSSFNEIFLNERKVPWQWVATAISSK